MIPVDGLFHTFRRREFKELAGRVEDDDRDLMESLVRIGAIAVNCVSD
jgi:hypothetical protein